MLALLAFLGAPAAAEEACRGVEHRGKPFTVCSADLSEHRIDLHLRDAAGAVLGEFAALPGDTLFAMNAGMYHPDRRPVGLYVEDGAEAARIVTSHGPGNFGMLPNGVFCIGDDAARVIESRAYAADPPACRDATQSGPMLLIDGAVHPRFIADSTFTNLRNGVGVSPDGGLAHFAISDRPVTFHEMATLFRDELGVRDALYFDGRVSRLFAPGIGRDDPGRRMGPIVAVSPR
nr:phosphodiester glycosidase family protein [Jannaschia sp. Os4]